MPIALSFFPPHHFFYPSRVIFLLSSLVYVFDPVKTNPVSVHFLPARVPPPTALYEDSDKLFQIPPHVTPCPSPLPRPQIMRLSLPPAPMWPGGQSQHSPTTTQLSPKATSPSNSTTPTWRVPPKTWPRQRRVTTRCLHAHGPRQPPRHVSSPSPVVPVTIPIF